MRAASLLLGAAALVAALAACSGPSAGDTFTPAPVAAETSTPTPAPTPTPTVVAAVIPGPQLPGVDAAAYMTGVLGAGVELDSPSGNIHCGIRTNYAKQIEYGCSIDDYHYTDPAPTAATADCAEMTHYGGGFMGTTDGGVETLCRGGVEFAGELQPVTVLPYGTSLSWNDVVCESYEDHMGCRSLVDGHGFTLARGEYSVF